MAKTWLITGSSRGIGRALAGSVLASGDNLVATARNVSGLETLIAPFGDRAIPVPLDMANFPAACNALETAVSTFGRLESADIKTLEADKKSQIDVMRVVEQILGLPSMNQTERTRMTSSSILIVKAWR